jgi:hypothetical protein
VFMLKRCGGTDQLSDWDLPCTYLKQDVNTGVNAVTLGKK